MRESARSPSTLTCSSESVCVCVYVYKCAAVSLATTIMNSEMLI